MMTQKNKRNRTILTFSARRDAAPLVLKALRRFEGQMASPREIERVLRRSSRARTAPDLAYVTRWAVANLRAQGLVEKAIVRGLWQLTGRGAAAADRLEAELRDSAVG